MHDPIDVLSDLELKCFASVMDGNPLRRDVLRIEARNSGCHEIAAPHYGVERHQGGHHPPFLRRRVTLLFLKSNQF